MPWIDDRRADPIAERPAQRQDRDSESKGHDGVRQRTTFWGKGKNHR